MTNYVPVAAFFSAFGLLTLPITLPLLATRDWRILITASTLLYFLFSAAIYDISALLDPMFYRRDGNFFVTFGGLLALLAFGAPSDAERWSVRLLLCVTTTYGIFFVFWLITGSTLRPDWLVAPYREFNPLFYANNACGGFLAMMCAISLGIAAVRRSCLFWALSTLLFVFCYFTSSRGSVVGLLFGAATTFLLERARLAIASSLVVFFLALSSFLLGIVMAIATDFDLSLTEEQARLLLYLDEGILDEKTANVLIRTHLLFPLAASLGLESPVFGLGFGSFDDRPYNIVSFLPGLLTINRPDMFLHTDCHAHNTFLHIFAELGIFGVVLVTLFFAALASLARDVPSKGLRLGLLIAFWTLMGSSVTEHRAFTPSNALPFVLLLGLALSGRFCVDLHRQSQRPLRSRRLR